MLFKVEILLLMLMLSFVLSACDDDIELDAGEEESYKSMEVFGSSLIGDIFSDDYYEDDTEDDQEMEYGNINWFETYNNESAETDTDAESITIMVYMCGSDLESEAGAATDDINEMLYAETGKNLKVVLQTGGAAWWQNNVISEDKLERYLVNGEEGLIKIHEKANAPMLDAGNLADFIKFSMKEYPADRYGLIFWDHGGGTIGGYGHDQNFPESNLSIKGIGEGLKKSGAKFDFIGFDCCLMSTIELANVLKPYTDYFIASEESESQDGWYYTEFLSSLENNPGLSVKEMARQIIYGVCSYEYNRDDYLASTLALIDLKRVPDVVEKLYDYLSNAEIVLRDDGFKTFSKARKNARDYGDGEFEQIDIVDFVEKAGKLKGSDELKAAVLDAVILKGSRDISSNGLAMYFPYRDVEDYSDYHELVNAVGLSGEAYNTFFDDFVTLKIGGYNDETGGNPYSNEELDYDFDDIISELWYDEDLAGEYEDYYSYVDTDELEITDKDGVYVLQLSDEDWDIVIDVEKQVYYDDGEGYLLLGSDDYVEFDDDGDLVVEYDYEWLYINECIIPYYYSGEIEAKDGSVLYLGYAPALLNGEEDINVWVSWSEEGEANVLGYKADYSDVSSKGYYKFKDGDTIDFLFSYFDYDGNYQDDYVLDDNTLVYSDDTVLELYYDSIGDVPVQVCCYLMDIYENEYWTEPLDYYIE